MKFRYQKIPFHGHDPKKPLVPRPYLPIYLYNKNKGTNAFYALLDSGADNILLPSELAQVVDIKNISDGKVESIIGVAGQTADVYFHNLEIQVVGDSRKLIVPVGFSELIYIPLIGRTFFQHFKSVIFNEVKEEIELKV